jgi:hypothetical protein
MYLSKEDIDHNLVDLYLYLKQEYWHIIFILKHFRNGKDVIIFYPASRESIVEANS